MNIRFLIWAVILIISLTATGLAMRVLALRNVPIGETLVLRGLVCLILAVVLAYRERLSLWPKSVKTQFVRALLAGLALTFFSLSYKWLTASTVSVLANIDVPLLVILGSLVGEKTSVRTKALSLISILFLVSYISGIETQTELFYGLSSLFAACILLCFGYSFIKKSMQEENQAITILVPSLAILFYGLLGQIGQSGPASTWNNELVVIDIISGIGMYVAYVATMRLYEVTNIAWAEFPTLIASLVMQPLEAILLHEPMQPIYLFSTLGFVLVVYFILRLQKSNSESYA